MVALSARRPSAWLLNLDAEDELRAKAHTASPKTLARLPDLTRALAALFGPDDVILRPGDRVPSSSSSIAYAGRAWCPTPRARAALARAGAEPVAAPSLAILRRVNHRRFAAVLGQTLPGGRYVLHLEDLAETIARESPSGHWLLKRPFGFAGRGRLRVARGALDSSSRAWVLASLREGEGLQVEPWVERAGDYALHGHLSARGDVVWGEPTQQECDARGAWRGTSRATDLAPSERDALFAAASHAATALAAAGYFGPFGVDAFRYRIAGETLFNPRCEINARYSMGWAIGMGPSRPDLDDA
jgi:hypothetical protein